MYEKTLRWIETEMEVQQALMENYSDDPGGEQYQAAFKVWKDLAEQRRSFDKVELEKNVTERKMIIQESESFAKLDAGRRSRFDAAKATGIETAAWIAKWIVYTTGKEAFSLVVPSRDLDDIRKIGMK